jgi:hypothetical protein
MMISEGSGMHADSMPIKRTMPRYPVALMKEVMKRARISRRAETMR